MCNSGFSFTGGLSADCRVNRIIKLLLPALLFLSTGVAGQSFSGKGGLISDIQPAFKIDSFPVEVSGISSRIDESFGLAKICFNINHPKISDLKIELLAPDGTSIWLSNRNGGDEGANYHGT